MSTKLKGDIAEQATILQALKNGWAVLNPIGDRMPYDLIFDIEGVLVKIQVKCAWLDRSSGNYIVDNRRTKTNRRRMLREVYKSKDFDFALVYLPETDVFYVLPNKVFTSYGSVISLVENTKRQRKPKSANYCNAWHLISQWAMPKET